MEGLGTRLGWSKVGRGNSGHFQGRDFRQTSGYVLLSSQPAYNSPMAHVTPFVRSVARQNLVDLAIDAIA